MEDKTEIFCNFRSGDSSDEFSLGRAGGGDGLCFGTIGYNTASEGETIAGSRAALAEVVAMGGIHITSELEWLGNEWEGWKSRGKIGSREIDEGKVGVRGLAPIVDAPGDSVAEVFGDAF